MTSPFREPSATKDDEPEVVFRDVPLKLWRPKRTMKLSRTLAGGRVHVFLGQSEAVWSLLQYAAGRAVPPDGSVTVAGAAPDQRAIPFHTPLRPKPPTWWRRLFFGREPLAAAQVERSLAGGKLCCVLDPFDRVESAEREAVVAAVRAARARGATVLLRLMDWRDALIVADDVHLFGRDGDPEGFGDVSAVFRPDVGDPIAPDAQRNTVAHGAAVDLDGVLVAVVQRGHELMVDGPGGGFTSWQSTSWFHVPARRVVLDPPFPHGSPSPSPPRVVQGAALIPRHAHHEEPLDTGPIDPTSRWIALDAEVVDRYAVGSFQRLTVRTTQSFHFHVAREESTRAAGCCMLASQPPLSRAGGRNAQLT